MADVLFSNTPLLKTCIGGLCPSLTFLQLGTWLQAHGHRATLHDVAVEQDVKGLPMEAVVEHIAARVVHENPAVLGLSCKVPADGRFCHELAAGVKRELPDVTILLGGIWATATHREILEWMPEVDGVVRGEGERAVLAIADRIERGASPFGDDVPGTTFRDAHGHIVANAPAPPVDPCEHPPLDLGLMPSPDSYTVFPYLTSKGCPYDCTFCAEAVVFPDHVETPIERLRADLALIEAFGRDYFLWLSDPLFGAKRSRLEAICDILTESRFHFLLESRVDVLRPEALPRLWEAGCELIYFGLESASYASLRRMDKVRSRTGYERYLRQAKALMAACMENDITPVFGVLNPIPGDTHDDLRTTLDFLAELRDVARATTGATGVDPGYHFYAFDYRFIRGTRDFARLDELAALGATWRNEPDDILRDVVIDAAAPDIPRSVALAFQRKVAGLVHTTPTGWERLQRSFPPQPLGGLG